MKIQQYYLACLSHASYLITDEKTKTAAVVDPQRDIDQYLADAAAAGATIRHVFLTHFHADFIAGHIELRDRAGATIHLGRRAQAEFECVSMKDGDTVTKGQTLGRSGTTGLAGGDHLHFTMLVGGVQVNPVEWWDAHWLEDRVFRKIREAGGKAPAPATK